MSETVNFVAEVNPKIKDSDPSCHVCGAVMMAVGTCDNTSNPHEDQGRCQNFRQKSWHCMSCGTTTECT